VCQPCSMRRVLLPPASPSAPPSSAAKFAIPSSDHPSTNLLITSATNSVVGTPRRGIHRRKLTIPISKPTGRVGDPSLPHVQTSVHVHEPLVHVNEFSVELTPIFLPRSLFRVSKIEIPTPNSKFPFTLTSKPSKAAPRSGLAAKEGHVHEPLVHVNEFSYLLSPLSPSSFSFAAPDPQNNDSWIFEKIDAELMLSLRQAIFQKTFV